MELVELFQQGGPLMWAILASSIVGVFVFFERLWTLRRNRVIPGVFVARIRGLVSKGKTGDALLLCDEHPSSIALILAAILRVHGQGGGRAAMKEALDEVGSREVAVLERRIDLLGTITAIAPLLGLLGTVVGMIEVFRQFVEAYKQGNMGPDTFANGIWQALITTAYGLFVAIPMALLHKYVQSQADHVVLDLEEDSLSIIEMLAPVASTSQEAAMERGLTASMPSPPGMPTEVNL